MAESAPRGSGRLVLLRHGETEWSRAHRHTGRTDLPLTATGTAQAQAAAPLLAPYSFVRVLSSPLRRAMDTARLALDEAGVAHPGPEADDGLLEWDYGDYEGLTTQEIRARAPDWRIFTDGAPGGESPYDVGLRVDRVLESVTADLARGDVLLVGHAHCLRVLAARWVGQHPSGGRCYRLDTGTVSVLGHEHGDPVLLRWNVEPEPDCTGKVRR